MGLRTGLGKLSDTDGRGIILRNAAHATFAAAIVLAALSCSAAFRANAPFTLLFAAAFYSRLTLRTRRADTAILSSALVGMFVVAVLAKLDIPLLRDWFAYALSALGLAWLYQFTGDVLRKAKSDLAAGALKTASFVAAALSALFVAGVSFNSVESLPLLTAVRVEDLWAMFSLGVFLSAYLHAYRGGRQGYSTERKRTRPSSWACCCQNTPRRRGSGILNPISQCGLQSLPRSGFR